MASRNPFFYFQRRGLVPSVGRVAPRYATNHLLIHFIDSQKNMAEYREQEGTPPPLRGRTVIWPQEEYHEPTN
jgi:hypothetical protein